MPEWAPEPPVEMPPGRLVHVEGIGEFFVRDTGGDGPPVLLLHGWMFASDLNWAPCYDVLRDAGYRVIAMDHRGHGRGLRTPKDFRLVDCAHDAAAVMKTMGVGPVIAVGYSMGGPITQLLAREHPETLAGFVCCATAQDWTAPIQKMTWKTLSFLRLFLGLFPTAFWDALLRQARIPDGPEKAWVASELTRGSASDIAEAGRELSRYDADPWIAQLRGLRSAVIVTAKDWSVPPKHQRRLARSLAAEVFEIQADHMAVSANSDEFNDALLRALRAVGEPAVKAVEAA